MVILGLTGSVAMGKSTAAAMFARQRVPVFDADLCVHRLMAPGGGAVAPVAAAFPGFVAGGSIERERLAACVFAEEAALRRLEAILHPLVRAERDRFVHRWRRAGRSLVVLDVPLLFETGMDARCDAVAVVSAPAFVQRQRLMRRPSMDARRIEATLRRQMPDREKRRRADFVIPSGLGRACTYRKIAQIIAVLRRRGGSRDARRRPRLGD
jgi:dephospho-CoA kinase